MLKMSLGGRSFRPIDFCADDDGTAVSLPSESQGPNFRQCTVSSGIESRGLSTGGIFLHKCIGPD